MSTTYKFMTGANQYKVHATTREEALRIIREALSPCERTLELIEATLYEEHEEARFRA